MSKVRLDKSTAELEGDIQQAHRKMMHYRKLLTQGCAKNRTTGRIRMLLRQVKRIERRLISLAGNLNKNLAKKRDLWEQMIIEIKSFCLVQLNPAAA